MTSKTLLSIFVICTFLLGGCGGSSSNSTSPSDPTNIVLDDPDTGMQYIEGTHFNQLAVTDPDAPDMMLFFSPACPHCRTFSADLTLWQAEEEEPLSFEHIPVGFGRPSWALLARIYALGRLHDKQEIMATALFACVHDDGASCIIADDEIKADEEILQWAADVTGIGFQQITETWQSDELTTQTSQYSQLEQDLNIRHVPLLIVNGQYEILRSGFSSNSDLFRLVRLLAETE